MMPALGTLGSLPDNDLRRVLRGQTLQFHLYAALRREQRAFAAAVHSDRSEASSILAFARAAYSELTAFLAGREVLDLARDGEWSLRDLLRHAIAVELRYRAQVLWSANRADADPVAIPPDRLPCDRLSPPASEFGDATLGSMERVLDLFGVARAATDEQLVTLGPSVLVRRSMWGSLEVDVRERLHQIGVHIVEVHLQAEKMLGATELEARRIIRRIAATRGLHEALSERHLLDELDTALATLGDEATSLKP